MNRVRRILFSLCVIALWVFTILISLEVWPRLQWYLTENNNPYILSRMQRLPWPKQVDYSVIDKEANECYRGRGKSTIPLPEITEAQELARRIPFFLDYNDPERYLFANVFGLHIFLLQKDGALTSSYSIPDYSGTDTIKNYVEDTDVQPILNAITQKSHWKSTVHFVEYSKKKEGDSFGYCLALPQYSQLDDGKSDEVWLMFADSEAIPTIADDSMWKLPFMTYKKHITKQVHTGILGISEEYYLNNYGFRDWDIILPKPKGTYRILCIGASTTEEGTRNELTYPAVLETKINHFFKDNFVDVINCGISGMNSMKHRMRFPDYLALTPNMLVIYNATNDICHQLLPRLVAEATPHQIRLRRSRFITEYCNNFLLPSDPAIRDAIKKHIMPNLRCILQESTKRGIKTALCSFAAPDPQKLSTEEYKYYNYLTMKEWGGSFVTFDSYLRILSIYNEELKKLCEAEGGLYIPVAEKLQGGAELFGDICHLRNSGVQNKANIIADILIPYLETVIID